MGSLFFLPKTRRFFFFGRVKKQEERTRQIDDGRKEGKAALRASLPSKVVSLSLFVKSRVLLMRFKIEKTKGRESKALLFLKNV